MQDRTDEVRKVVEKYDGFEFVSLRIEDAFDSNWWARVGGKDKLKERDLGIDLNDEGKSTSLYYSIITFNNKIHKNYHFYPFNTPTTLLLYPLSDGIFPPSQQPQQCKAL
jgi:hypothetical protein